MVLPAPEAQSGGAEDRAGQRHHADHQAQPRCLGGGLCGEVLAHREARRLHPRRLIGAAIRQADALITVSEALGRGVAALGADAANITTLRNGVDITLFTPLDRAAARAAIGLENPYILSVGHLIPRKGHDRVIEAFAAIADTVLAGHDLVIAGDGPERERLTQLAKSRGLAAPVREVGAMPPPRLPLD
jgi:glycosyltransferase involved in cell wall biosynthesis